MYLEPPHRCPVLFLFSGVFIFFSPQRALWVRGRLANNGKQSHGEYQRPGKCVHGQSPLQVRLNNNANRRRKEKEKIKHSNKTTKKRCCTQQRYPGRRYPHDPDLRPTLPAPSACYLLHTGLPKVFSPATANALLFFVVSLLGISVPAAFHQRFRTGYVFQWADLREQQIVNL